MKNMTKKKKIKIVIAVVVFVLFEIFCGVGFTHCQRRDIKRRGEVMFSEARDYLQADLAFREEYGEILDIRLSENEEIRYIVEEKKRWIPCHVSTQDGKAYLVWVVSDVSVDPTVHTYVEVTDITGDNS